MKVTQEDVGRWIARSGVLRKTKSESFPTIEGAGFYISPILISGRTFIMVFTTDGAATYDSEEAVCLRYGGKGDLLRRIRDFRMDKIDRKAIRGREAK